jgi:hypothetical protein
MKAAVLIVVGLFLSSSVAVFGLRNQEPIQSKTLSLAFREPIVTGDGLYTKVTMTGAPACLYRPGNPVLPMYTTTLELPFGSTINDVQFDCGEIQTMVLTKKIAPAPYPIIEGSLSNPLQVLMDENVYGSDKPYPSSWVSYSTGGGLNQQHKHVTFLTLQVFPVRYSPETDTIYYLTKGQTTVTYQAPTHNPFPETAIYNLVIIAPSQFVLPLQRLAEHKNNFSVLTQIKTLGEIYRDYPGADKPEQIKYFIKDAVENWGTTYVLLVGGLKSHIAGNPRDDINEGTRDWHVPVRYSNLWDAGTPYDPGFISDLYYADIYNSQGSFCSWDSNGDGIYGAWSDPNPLQSASSSDSISRQDPPLPLDDYPIDEIDLYPDVIVGRLPCRNVLEVTMIVNKIISYEKQAADPSWFKKIVVVGGDPYNDSGTDFNEGELIGEKILSYLPGFQQVKLFASYQKSNPDSTPMTRNIVREISSGCGFLFFDGHGGPAWWNTYWPGQFDALIKNGGLSIYQKGGLQNGERLPVCIVGGCHCSQFNVSLLSTITDPKNVHSMWSYGLPIGECWSWSLVMKAHGGAIASIGTTGLGYEAGGEVGDLDGNMVNEPDCVEALNGYLEAQFFKAYGVDNNNVLGDNWCAAISQYLGIYPGMKSRNDAKTIEQWVLLGDPSLQIGGYGS